MRTHLPGVTAAVRHPVQRADWRSRWIELSALVLITVVLVDCLSRPWKPPMLAPLLAVPPALAGIGAPTVRRPLGCGVVSLLAAVIIAARPTEYAGWLPGATIFTVAVITVVATAGTAINVRQEQRIAEVRSVAEVAQRALLRPPPPHLGPLGFDVVYMAAAAEAKVGGDLYGAVATREYGIRMIMGDVRGKGLGAVELATDVLSTFREQAHDARTLGELATRLDAGLGRGLGRHEEFVTALLVEIDPESGRASIFNCGHPPPLLIPAAGDAAAGSVTLLEVPAPAPPLGLLGLGDASAAQLSYALQPNEKLLLYTDGVTEARDARRAFYPLADRIGALAAKAATGQGTGKPILKPVPNVGGRQSQSQGLLDLVIADLHRHVGAPLDDDAALLLVHAPATWPSSQTQATTAGGTRITA
jgi:serine phosphatase RsbU (regulator of sigma subunit)